MTDPMSATPNDEEATHEVALTDAEVDYILVAARGHRATWADRLSYAESHNDIVKRERLSPHVVAFDALIVKLEAARSGRTSCEHGWKPTHCPVEGCRNATPPPGSST